MKKRKISWSKIVIVVLLVVMAVTVLLLYTKFTELISQITYLQDTTNVILTDVDGLETGIAQRLEEETSMVEDYSIEITDMDFAAETYEVSVELILKEYTDSTQVSVYFGTLECPLQKDGYIYKGVATLPLDNSYEGNLTFLFSDGTKKNTEVFSSYIGVQNYLEQALSGSITQSPKYKDGELSLKDDLDYVLEGSGQYEFEQFELAAVWNDEEIFCQNLMNVSEEMPQTGIASAIRESEDTTSAEMDSDAAEEYTVSSETGTYSFELSYEPEEAGQLRVFLRAVSTEGYRFEYDLFCCEMTEDTDGDSGELTLRLQEDSFDWTAHYVVYDTKGGSLVLQ